MRRIEGFRWGEFNFIHNTKPPNLGKHKKCIGGGVWRAYVSSSIILYVVIIF